MGAHSITLEVRNYFANRRTLRAVLDWDMAGAGSWWGEYIYIANAL